MPGPEGVVCMTWEIFLSTSFQFPSPGCFKSSETTLGVQEIQFCVRNGLGPMEEVQFSKMAERGQGHVLGHFKQPQISTFEQM